MFVPRALRSMPLALLGPLIFAMHPAPGFAQVGRTPMRGQQGVAPSQGNGSPRSQQTQTRNTDAARAAGIGIGLGIGIADAAIRNQQRTQEPRRGDRDSMPSSTRRRPDSMGPNYPPNGGGVHDYRPQYTLPQYDPAQYAQPTYPQFQPVAVQPNVVAPTMYVQPVAAAVTVPANTVPQPTAPQRNQVPTANLPSVAPRNAVGSPLALAGSADRSKIAKTLDKQLKSRAKEFGKDVEGAGLAFDDVAARLEDVVKSHGVATKDLEAAIEEGSSRAVDKALKAVAGISDGERRKLVAEFNAGLAARDFQDALRAGVAHEELADAYDRLDDALNRSAGGKAGTSGKLDALRREAESSLQLAEIRDLSKSKPTLPEKAGGWIHSPDQLMIVETPGYLPGTTLVLGPDLVVLGTVDSALTVHPGTLADLGVAVPAGPPVADSGIDSSADAGRGVVIVNPGETGGGIHYTVSGHPFAMQPGESQTLATGTTWVISFDKGDARGQVQYTLADGSYEFFVTDAGWDLRSKLYSVTLDNATNTHEFHFVVDGKADVVPARQNKTLRSKWPVALTFDRGDGKAPARKEIPAGTYRVGVDLASNLLELYPGKGSTLVADTNTASSLSPRGN